MSTLRRILFVSVPAQSAAAFRRDIAEILARSILMTLFLALGGQVVQALGGTDIHVAAIRTSMSVGLLLSLLYVRLGHGRSPLRLIAWPESVARLLACGIAFVSGTGRVDATAFTVIACTSVALGALSLPYLSTVYGLVYPPRERASLVAQGRMVQGIVSILAAWLCGRLLSHDISMVRALYPASGLLAAGAIWYFCTMPVPEARAPESRTRPSAWSVWRKDKAFRRFQVSQFVLGFANLGAMPVIDVYVRRELGLRIDLAAVVVTHGILMSAMKLLTVRLHGTLFDLLGVVKHRVLTSIFLGLSFVAWAFSDGIAMASVAAILGGIGMAGGQIIWMIGSLNFAPKEQLSTYAGIHTFLTGVRGVLAPACAVTLLGSGWFDGNHRAFFLCVALLIFASAVGHAFFVDAPEGRIHEVAS